MEGGVFAGFGRFGFGVSVFFTRPDCVKTEREKAKMKSEIQISLTNPRAEVKLKTEIR